MRRPLPVIILTARGAEDDRVRGLGAGGGRLRGQAVLDQGAAGPHRSGLEADARAAAGRPAARIRGRRGRPRAARGRFRRRRSGASSPIASGSYLHYLACHAGRAVSRDELLARVWGLNPAGITTRTIDMHIARLREKLRDDKDKSADRADGARPGLHARRREASMKRLGRSGWSSAFCVALAAGAMARLGDTALELERAEARAQRQADARRKPATRALADGFGARRP